MRSAPLTKSARHIRFLFRTWAVPTKTDTSEFANPHRRETNNEGTVVARVRRWFLLGDLQV